MRKRITVLAMLPALAAPAQYVGKVGAQKPPTLRATAVYEYTGTVAKPNASRLVPVVVWDGTRYEPGGLYLARPEPLAVAPGTQYVLEQSGVSQGLFDVSSAARMTSGGGWVGLGRFQPEVLKPEPKLVSSKDLPVLAGGSGMGKADSESDAGNGPVLHRKTDSGTDSGTDASEPTLHRKEPSGTPSQTQGQTPGQTDSDKPTLHRREAGDTAPAADPDRPTLHSPTKESTGPAPDPDRPTLHRHADTAAATTTAPDPDRPHLRYGQGPSDEGRVQPALLGEKAPATGTAAQPAKVGEMVAVSDVETDEAHPFLYTWPSPAAKTEAENAMHAAALRALANAVKASFGPAARTDTALRNAADAAEASFGPGAKSGRTRRASAASAPDLLVDPAFTAWELSYGGGATFVYSAHTADAGPARRYVTVIAQPDFAGKPHVVFSQATRGDMLDQTPALHLIDAVDANGDHRAELLFSRQDAEAMTNPAAARQFALYSVVGGQAKLVYSSAVGVPQ